MIISNSNIQTLGIAFNSAFKDGLASASSVYKTVCMEVPSSTLTEEYAWLGEMPQIREWLSERVIQGLSAYRYAISNRDFELTIAVKRNNIMDDNIGIYTPLFSDMGRKAGEFPDKLTLPLLSAGFTSLCYDGQYFFDTDHPVKDAAGNLISVANTDAVAGTGPAWFLLDTSRALKPLIYQNRMPFNFVKKDRPEHENVFDRKEYIYGIDGRSNAGYGLWQLAWGSMQPLDDTHYGVARAAMQAMRGDYDQRLGINPTVLVVPPSLEKAGRQLIKADRDAAGASNVWADSAQLIVTPWL